MKQNKISIKYRVLGIFGVFTVGIISSLWLFQIVFLNDFYQFIKLNEIKTSADVIEKYMGNEKFDNIASNIAASGQQCLQIIDLSTNTRISIEGARDCMISKFSYGTLLNYYAYAKSNGGTYSEIKVNPKLEGIGLPFGDSGPSKSIIYAKITKYNDLPVLLILNTSISPLDATVNTLKIQLACLSVILLIFSFVLAYYIAKKITKPITDINTSAKELATGNYNVLFKASGYKEIAELGDTLTYAANELSKVDHLRNELIANISHDLRTPLTMIGGYAQVMKDLPGENTPENVQVIIDETARLTSLVNDVLDISKLQSGNQALNLEVFDLTELILNLKGNYAKLVERDHYKINFIFDLHVFIKADKLRISQVVYNLMNNALTYTGSDMIVEIKQSIVNDSVLIEIIDHGQGIDEENIKFIWDRYYKANNQHKRAVSGTGLGLSIVKSNLNLHNQAMMNVTTYGATSKVNEGSNFYFTYKVESLKEEEKLIKNKEVI